MTASHFTNRGDLYNKSSLTHHFSLKCLYQARKESCCRYVFQWFPICLFLRFSMFGTAVISVLMLSHEVQHIIDGSETSIKLKQPTNQRAAFLMRSGDVNSPPSLSHKQTVLCICEIVVLYATSPKWCLWDESNIPGVLSRITIFHLLTMK